MANRGDIDPKSGVIDCNDSGPQMCVCEVWAVQKTRKEVCELSHFFIANALLRGFHLWNCYTGKTI